MFGKAHRPFVCMVLASLLSLLGYAHAENEQPNYALTETLPFPGATHWDLLTFDPKERRLFITRGDSVDVFDVTTKKIVGSLPADGAHGVALAPEFGKGFISNGKSHTVTMFDMATLKPFATVPTGAKPDTVVYDPKTKHVFVANADSGDMTVIDARDGSVLGTIKLDGQPEFVVLDGKGKLYVNLEDTSQIDVVDTKAFKVLNHFDLAPTCDGPTGLALDKAKNRLFSTCANKTMLVINAANGHILEILPIGEHSDAALFDNARGLAFSSNGDGTLTVVGSEGGHYKVLQTVQTKLTARTMALDPLTHAIYLVAADTEGFDPPTDQHPKPRPHILPGSFMVLVVSEKK